MENRSDIFFFSFKKAVDDIINQFDIELTLDTDIFISINILAINRIYFR